MVAIQPTKNLVYKADNQFFEILAPLVAAPISFIELFERAAHRITQLPDAAHLHQTCIPKLSLHAHGIEIVSHLKDTVTVGWFVGVIVRVRGC